MKTCTKCRLEKDESEFTKNKSKRSGYSSWCKVCCKLYLKIYHKVYQERNKVRVSAERKELYKNNPQIYKEIHLKSKYGILLQDFNDMLAIQEERCSICGKNFGKKNPPCVDHCHESNAVRGLLCRKCNWAIGFLQDSPVLCRVAADYLEIHKNLLTTERNRETIGSEERDGTT